MSSTVRRFLYSVFFGQRSPQLPFWSSIMSEGGTISGAKHALDGSEDKGAKRLKSETETSNSESQLGKAKAKKMALCMSYNGKDYLGMQRNPGTKTIEDDLLQAMYKGDLILKEHVDVPQAMKFQRAARTDKGVSAVRQIVSLKLPTNLTVEEMVDKINSHLVDQIRVIDIKRTTRGFNCKNSCDSRTYTYVLPTFAFAPPGSPAEESYRITEERIGEVNNVLALYKGCHNYHNFTSGKKSEDPSAMRYIISAECGQPFVQGDQEFVQVQIKGQSFMLHQIRKMVGLVIAIMRGCTKETTIRRAWGPEKLDLPIAPALGLMLEEVHYDRYNKRYGGDGLHEPLTWEEKQDIIQSFKEKHIYPTILETEKNEKSMLTWMENLPLHTYDVREPGPPTSDEAEHCDIAAEQEHVSCNELQGQDCEQETLVKANPAEKTYEILPHASIEAQKQSV
ncbi:tRNA pseudouridine synthase A [Ixodes scapularis]|uniref:tRNA pseudouridine synthase A n=1 Tax=Ixodes scapularis TaxID=6945 RepID=UPI001A9E294C|nr:tRNA pseudouridine synthase A [Ixodes scapularis]XP_029834805.2 tRNA pseudouridine synthase A [Ixodes scapularis]